MCPGFADAVIPGLFEGNLYLNIDALIFSGPKL